MPEAIADTLATLVPRYRSELKTWDSELPCSDALAAWTLRQIASTPALTKADALAALDLVDEELDLRFVNEWRRGHDELEDSAETFASLIEALRRYIR